MDLTEQTLFAPSTLAKRWDVSTKTIYRLIKANVIKAKRTPGGEIRVPLTEVQRYERSLVAA